MGDGFDGHGNADKGELHVNRKELSYMGTFQNHRQHTFAKTIKYFMALQRWIGLELRVSRNFMGSQVAKRLATL